jgi:CBS domain-containing protein
MTTAGEFCNRHVVIASAAETLLDAARRMLDRHVGCVVVVEERTDGAIPVGMLTDRDIVVGVLARTDRHLHAIQVGDVMSEPPMTVNERESLHDVLKQMRAFGVRRMPVVDDRGALQGLIGFDDLVESLKEQLTDLASLLARQRQREADEHARPPLTPR